MTHVSAGLLLTGLLGLLLAAAAWQDFFRLRIPNAIVLPGILLALMLQSALPGTLGITDGLAGLGIGLAALLPAYLMRALGAGDVKLMAMVGAFLGLRGAIGAVLFTWLAGALFSLLVALRRGALAKLAGNLRVMWHGLGATLAAAEGPAFDARDSAARFPYSAAIAVGTAAFLLLKYFPS